jgi:fibrillarin-like pre-rRNA processing protein
MKSTDIPGVFKDKNKIFTENPKSCKGKKVYNERFVRYKSKEFRAWNPYRSKLAAAILNGLSLKIKSNSNVLYLGAATGTTVSHISDILMDGTVYSVENSPIAVKKFLNVCKNRKNIIPILEDANHPDRYSLIVPIVDIVYQDISQRNQAEIFIENISRYLKEDGIGIIMVKARSIDISLKPEKAFDLVCLKLKKNGFKILNKLDLKPYEKDHAAIMISY